MARILAIDYGTKRCGIAITDNLKLIATALATVQPDKIWEFLNSYFEGEEVEEIVVGLPFQTNNLPSQIFDQVKSFVTTLKKRYPQIRVTEFDERFTSKMAHQVILESGLGKLKRQEKGMVDRISATILLQSYMEQIQNFNNRK